MTWKTLVYKQEHTNKNPFKISSTLSSWDMRETRKGDTKNNTFGMKKIEWIEKKESMGIGNTLVYAKQYG